MPLGVGDTIGVAIKVPGVEESSSEAADSGPDDPSEPVMPKSARGGGGVGDDCD